MADENEKNAVPGDGGKKKMIIVLIVIVVILGGYASVSLFSGPVATSGSKNIQNNGLKTKYDPLESDKKKLLIVDLGDIVASMPSLAPGLTSKKQIKMHPYLLLKPFRESSTEVFNDEKNRMMLDQYKLAKPILIEIILETVNQMVPSQNYGPKDMARHLRTEINLYDSRTSDVKTNYSHIFGNRVLEVYFTSYDKR